jgi:hypothetical protein
MEIFKIIALQNEHYKDLLHQAEQNRLIQQALEDQPHRPSFLRLLLNWLKQWIVSLGCLLQTQFARRALRSSISPNRDLCQG